MTNFLNKYFDDASINEINTMLGKTILYNLSCNQENVINIIEYLKSIGIVNIKELIIYKTDIFLNTKDKIEKLFNRFNLNELVNIINNNYDEIDKIFD